MTQNTKIQKIKLFIKASIIVAVLFVFVVLGIFIRPASSTFENSYMKRWLVLNEQQRISTLNRVVNNADNQELLFKCVDKIAQLPDSNEMLIRDAISFCYNGIQINTQKTNSDEE